MSFTKSEIYEHCVLQQPSYRGIFAPQFWVTLHEVIIANRLLYNFSFKGDQKVPPFFKLLSIIF